MSPEEEKIRKMIIEEVFLALSSERYYQDHFVDPDANRREVPVHSVGDLFMLAEAYMNEAKSVWKTTTGFEPTLDVLRKVAGILVKMFEIHGVPSRFLPQDSVWKCINCKRTIKCYQVQDPRNLKCSKCGGIDYTRVG